MQDPKHKRNRIDRFRRGRLLSLDVAFMVVNSLHLGPFFSSNFGLPSVHKLVSGWVKQRGKSHECTSFVTYYGCCQAQAICVGLSNDQKPLVLHFGAASRLQSSI